MPSNDPTDTNAPAASPNPPMPADPVEQTDSEFLHDLAGRLFRHATPAMGFDQSDTDRLYRMARTPAPAGDVRVRQLVEAVESGQFDALEAVADQWIASAGIQRMSNAIASVFEKYAPQDVMDRFREKIAALMHLAFVEGAAQGVLQIKPGLTPTPDSSAVSGSAEGLREALQEIIDQDDVEATISDLMQHDRNAGYLTGVRDCANIARAALTEGQQS